MKGLRGLAIEISFDPSLRQRFIETYVAPRKQSLASLFEKWLLAGRLRADTDIAAVVDVLYGFDDARIQQSGSARFGVANKKAAPQSRQELVAVCLVSFCHLSYWTHFDERRAAQKLVMKLRQFLDGSCNRDHKLVTQHVLQLVAI